MSSAPASHSRTSVWPLLVFVLLATTAWLAVRTPELANRPMHGDEAVNAYRVGELLSEGRYIYDPTEHHGPTLIYGAAAIAKAFGTESLIESNEQQIRLTTVLVGLVLVLVLPLLVDGVGRLAVWLAGLLLILDPAIAFYSRYYIHETVLVAGSALALAAGWRWTRSGSWIWAALLGMALALMFATKTTAVLMYAAAGLALAPEVWRHLRKPGSDSKFGNAAWQHALLIAGMFVLTWALLYSSFFTNLSGLRDSIIAFGHYFERGMGGNPEAADHLHPWYYHVQRLLFIQDDRGFIWSHALVLVLSVIGAFAPFMSGKQKVTALRNFLSRYALIQIAIYSVIPYKTPWLTLGMMYALLILAGCGAAALLRTKKSILWRSMAGLIIALVIAYQGAQTWRACYQHPAHPRNPYIYGQTSPDFLRLTQRVRDLATLTEDGKNEFIGVYTDFPWPLPWYLRDFERVGYWEELPESLYALQPRIFAISPELAESLPETFLEGYLLEYYGHYHGAHLMLGIELDLWEEFMAHQAE